MEEKKENKVKKTSQKAKKFYVKKKHELGFERRIYFIPGYNERFTIVAGEEIDEKDYNKFSSEAKNAFFESR